MSFKSLLVHLDDTRSCAGRLAAAIDLARACEAHLTGLYVSAEAFLPGSVRGEVPGQLIASLEEQRVQRAKAVMAQFEETSAKSGISFEGRTERGVPPQVVDIVSLHARYADLVILGQPEPDTASDIDAHLAEGVILSSGRPGLVIPYIGAGKTLGRRVLVAWDAGREAARAVNDALPFLRRADKVTILVVSPHKGRHGQEPGADIALYLARHGVRAEAQQLTAGELSVGNTLLSRLADLDIDLLVMGAYGHSRVREWILGGVTREILRQMTVPVFMSH